MKSSADISDCTFTKATPMRMRSMYHSRAAYIIHMYPQRSSDLASRCILHLQALDISQ